MSNEATFQMSESERMNDVKAKILDAFRFHFGKAESVEFKGHNLFRQYSHFTLYVAGEEVATVTVGTLSLKSYLRGQSDLKDVWIMKKRFHLTQNYKKQAKTMKVYAAYTATELEEWLNEQTDIVYDSIKIVCNSVDNSPSGVIFTVVVKKAS